jgi:NAD(P)-dependent dehydrogenase (short-subunit alcohol dehydrogenase family)
MSTVLVTGASSGIGQSTAVELAQRGTGVILTYRGNPAGAQQTVAEIHALGATGVALELDTSRIDTFPAFVDNVYGVLHHEFGTDKLDGLVNNAGLSHAAMFEQMEESAFDQLVDTLFKGPYFLTQALLPILADGAAIVNTTSSATNPFDLSAGYSAYGSVKGAVVVWTRYLAKELSARRIRVNSVSPGPTRTRLGDDGFAKYPEVIAPLAERTALGRIGEGADVGKVIAFLLSDESGWITAQDIEASGGFNL